MLCSSLDQRNELRLRLAELAAIAASRPDERDRLAPQAQPGDEANPAHARAIQRRAGRVTLGGRDAA